MQFLNLDCLREYEVSVKNLRGLCENCQVERKQEMAELKFASRIVAGHGGLSVLMLHVGVNGAVRIRMLQTMSQVQDRIALGRRNCN